MSADPLLELLRGSIPEGGKLTLQAFNSFLDYGDSGITVTVHLI
jgi:hypothetical protein